MVTTDTNNLFNFFGDAYKDLICRLHDRGKIVGNTKEILNANFEVLNPNYNLFVSKNKSSETKYIANELIWYLSGEKSVKFISKHASLWDKISDEFKNANSNYGNLIFYEENKYGFTQYDWVIYSLKENINSRQAIVHFNNSEHQYLGVKDFPCTMYGIFNIRDNTLNFSTYMRSQDIIYGLLNDYVFFNFLHQHVFLELKKHYNTLEMGTYYHEANSLHVYEKHYGLLNNLYDEFICEADSTIHHDKIPELEETLFVPCASETHHIKSYNLKQILECINIEDYVLNGKFTGDIITEIVHLNLKYYCHASDNYISWVLNRRKEML